MAKAEFEQHRLGDAEFDYLKEKSSAVSEAVYSQYQMSANFLTASFGILYGQYMPSKRRLSTLLDADRFILTNDSLDKKHIRKGFRKTPFAAYFNPDGDYIVINYDYMTDLSLPTLPYITITLNEMFSSLYAHELAHKFQDHSLARMYLELGSAYYAQRLHQLTGLRFVSEILSYDRAGMYERIVTEATSLTNTPDGFGPESVHHLFFGTADSEDTKYLIYSLLDNHIEELMKLFPEVIKENNS